MPTKFQNIQKLVQILEAQPGGLTLDQIQGNLRVNVRTAKRYIQELRKNGYPVLDTRTAANKPSCFCLSAKWNPPPELLPQLLNLKQELNSWGNPKFSRLIDSATHFIQRISGRMDGEHGANPLMAGNNVYYVDHGPFSQTAISGQLLRQLESAIEGQEILKIHYKGYDRSYENTLFYPYKLSLRVGTLYLIGRISENKGPFKSLSVKRLVRCQATGKTFSPAEFFIEDYYKYVFGQFPRQPDEKPITLKLKIKKIWLVQFLKESHFNPPGTWMRQDGFDVFQVKLIAKPDLINWVLSYYPFMVPLLPVSLVKEVQLRLNTAWED